MRAVRSERQREACKAAVAELSVPLVTCEAVIAESCWLLRKLHGAADAVLENVEEGIFQLPFRLSSSTRPVTRRFKLLIELV